MTQQHMSFQKNTRIFGKIDHFKVENSGSQKWNIPVKTEEISGICL